MAVLAGRTTGLIKASVDGSWAMTDSGFGKADEIAVGGGS